MDKNEERNLNITLKNESEDKDEVVISLFGIIKKLKKYLLIWIVTAVVCFVLSFGYAILTTHIKKSKLSALVSFSYNGIEKGQDPSGRKFDVNSIKNPAVIETALTELDIDMEQLEYIRQGISFYAIIPRDTVDRITVYESVLELNGNVNAAEKLLDTTYYPTQYKVFFDYNDTTLTSEQALNVFNTILDTYQDYFYEQYGYNESLGSAVTAIDYNSYDYSEAVDVFENSLDNLRNYVRQLANEDNTRFRSTVTGYTFDDLSEAIKTVKDIDLDKISSYVSINNITKDKEESLAYYDYRIKALTREKARLEEQLASVNESIEKYKKDDIVVFSSGTESPNTEYSLASEQYDNMQKQKLNITSELATTKQRINYYKERQEALNNAKSGTTAQTEKVQGQLDAVYEKIQALVEQVSLTSDDYYKNVTFKNAYNVLVPATDTTVDRIGRIIDNAKMPFIALEAAAVFVYFAVAFIEALVDENKKRKLEKEVESYMQNSGRNTGYYEEPAEVPESKDTEKKKESETGADDSGEKKSKK